MKLGVHLQNDGPTIPSIEKLLGAGIVMPVVLSVNNLGICKKIKEISPQTMTILRFHGDEDFELGRYIENRELSPPVIAKSLFDYIRSLNPNLNLEEMRFVDYVNCVNECAVRGRDNYVRLAQVSMHLSSLFNQYYRKPMAHLGIIAGGCEWDEMIALRDAGFYEWLRSRNEILLVHEGLLEAPNVGVTFKSPIQTGFGQEIPGLPDDVKKRVKNAGWLVFRYRYHKEAAGFPVRIVVSEFYAGGSYYLEDLPDVVGRTIWYLEEAQKDDYLIGVCPFTCGPYPNWSSQNYDPFYLAKDGFVDAIISRKDKTMVGKRVSFDRYAVNLRSGPGLNHSILTVIQRGSILPIIEERSGWLRVTSNGWVSRSFVSII